MSVPVKDCAWCRGLDDFEPFDLDDADQTLCLTHVAEYAGTSVTGLERMDAAQTADMADLGYFD
jgi:hypothetical protein